LYAIVDIETTGRRLNEDRITEIAILLHDGTQVTERFHTLINPERVVPDFITQLTGISTAMVADAPKFYEVAKDIVTLTEGRILVAHNAYFDYSFLRQEFNSLGFRFVRKTLCTLRLSRQLFPKLPSYSLKNLCIHFGIRLEAHHRALDDATATVSLLQQLLQKNTEKVTQQVVENEISVKIWPPKVSMQVFEWLPEETGVYYFLNETGRIIYVGKSKNIKKRIASHFSTNLHSPKTIEFKNQVASINYILTGSELAALLLESAEIKRWKPLFNRQQRRTRHQYGVFSRNGREGYLKFFVDKLQNQPNKIPLAATASLPSAKAILYRKAQEHQLCLKLCGLYDSAGACFDYQVKVCQGACVAEEAPQTYNTRALAALESFSHYKTHSFVIRDKGREPEEQVLAVVRQGRYLGWGYAPRKLSLHDWAQIKPYITAADDNRDIQKIIGQWLKQQRSTVHWWSEDEG
jgi:DNA polymerase-3 subunit epsilon